MRFKKMGILFMAGLALTLVGCIGSERIKY